MEIKVFLERCEEGGFIAKCVKLPVVSQGKTKEEALKNIKKAVKGYLEVKDSDKTDVIVEVVTEENIVNGLPEALVSSEENEEIKRSVQEMKRGNFVTLYELNNAGESEKDKAAKRYMEGKISISGASEMAKLTIPEMVDYLVSKGFKSDYSTDDLRRGVALLKKKLKQE